MEWREILAMKKAVGGDRREDLRLLRVPLLVAVPRDQGGRSTPGCSASCTTAKSTTITASARGTGQYRWNTKRSAGGSALLTAGCHALDALLLCMDGEVEEVTSYATQSANPIFTPYEYPTTSTTILKFRNGSVGKCAAVVDCLQPYYFHTHLVGSEGSILDNKFHSQKLAGLTNTRGASCR